ncbi:hypothetical protein GF357_02015 [Candidatus Dojkabacteria bacterium]|nr:hypothetical protein [Candidatus Dojkabacteria bacterium]
MIPSKITLKTKYVLYAILGILSLLLFNRVSAVIAEQAGDSPESGTNSRLNQLYESLISLNYGDEGTGDWGGSGIESKLRQNGLQTRGYLQRRF